MGKKDKNKDKTDYDSVRIEIMPYSEDSDEIVAVINGTGVIALDDWSIEKTDDGLALVRMFKDDKQIAMFVRLGDGGDVSLNAFGSEFIKVEEDEGAGDDSE